MIIDTARGTGRTSRQLAALPDGGVYVVAHAQHIPYCKSLLVYAGRRNDAVRFVTLDAVRDGSLRGLSTRTPIGVDHHAWDMASQRTCEELHIALSRVQWEEVA